MLVLRPWSVAVAVLVATLAACRHDRSADGGAAGAVPSAANAVVQLEMPAVRDTWMAPALAALARHVDIPPCVIAQARAADSVTFAWSEQLPSDGWLIIVRGGERTPCPPMIQRGPLATWHRDLPPRADDDPGFFADRERRARLTRRRASPVRMVGEYVLSAGITAYADAGFDPRDGIIAAASVRFDAGSAADGARLRFDRWRANLDASRLGGAWPALAAIAVAGPVAGTPRLDFTLAMPGPSGADAAALLLTAFAGGAIATPRMPCPPPTALQRFRLRCADGEVKIPVAAQAGVRAAAVDDLTMSEVTDHSGRVLSTIERLAPTDVLVALGLALDDTVLAIDDRALPARWPAALVERLGTAAPGATLTMQIKRAGRALTLRYRIEP